MTLQLTKPLLGKPELDAVERVLSSGWLAEGVETEAFERKVADYVHAKFAVAVSNCTVAIELALRAHEVSHRVAVPDFSHPATAQAVLNAGATPVLCDVSLDDFNLGDVVQFTEASVPVSWAGTPVTRYPRCLIVEDAACSLGASFQGKMVGSEFTSCFSFHPRKLVTCGEGAVITTNEEKIAEKIRELKNFGKDGGNYRLNDISAAIGSCQLDRLEYIISKRTHMSRVYSELLHSNSGVKLPEAVKGARQTWQTFAVLVETANRTKIIAKLKALGIEVQVGAYALHLLPQFHHLKRMSLLENSSLLHSKLLALPMSYDLTEEDQQRVVYELTQALHD